MGDAFGVRYAIGCETAAGMFWDNNLGPIMSTFSLPMHRRLSSCSASLMRAQ